MGRRKARGLLFLDTDKTCERGMLVGADEGEAYMREGMDRKLGTRN